ncbi:hypothetical protein LCGC14_3141570, partial [marine sediment metagenome]
MEFMGVLYSVGLVLFMFMLRKGESMCAPTDVVFIDGCQSGGIVDRQSRRFLSWNRLENALHSTGIVLTPENVKERHDRTFRLSESRKVCDITHCVDYKKETISCGRCEYRYQPAKSTVLVTPTEKRYFRLYNGD